jgi:carbon-monoxide dehydrogenase small subunit
LKLNLTVNGEKKIFEIEPNELLIDVLRTNGYKSVKRGCNSADCGSCTVLKNGKAILSCSTLAASAENAEITTVEAFGTHLELDEVQQAFVDESAFQCGFCAPGMILATKEFIEEFKTRENKKITEHEIKERLTGNLCRCTGYESQIKAVENLIRNYGGEVE